MHATFLQICISLEGHQPFGAIGTNLLHPPLSSSPWGAEHSAALELTSLGFTDHGLLFFNQSFILVTVFYNYFVSIRQP